MGHGVNLHDGTGIIAKDPGLGILLSHGSTVPTTRVGYAPGSIFIKSNGTTLATVLYVNIGTKAACNFVLLGGQNSSPTDLIGYATGAGGAVTQITSSATAVTLNKPVGQITTVALTTAAAAEETFTVNNSLVAATDIVVVSTTYNGAGTPMVGVQAVAAGSFKINITNLHAANALNALMVINFAVIKGVAA